MTSTLFEALHSEARSRLLDRVRGKRLVLPEGNDERCQEAAALLKKECGLSVQLVTPEEASEHKEAVRAGIESLAQSVGKKASERFLEGAADPLFYAGHLLRKGDCDAVVAGAVSETAQVLRAVLATVGLAKDTSCLTSVMLMALKSETAGGQKVLCFGDSGVIPQPSILQLSDIGVLAARAFENWLGEQAVTAFLSFATAGSARHSLVEAMREARNAFSEREPLRPVFGEVQFDVAVEPQVAARKLKGNVDDPWLEWRGKCNVLVFPDLNSGNICYKAVERLAGAAAWGPIVLGAARPYADLSRGCSAKDIAHVACLALCLAEPA